jgi:alkylation response protein AidB-like acyl-CoA dehydrogenase
MTTATMRKGGDWLTSDVPAGEVFTPERLTDEHRLIGRTATEFATNEIKPAEDQLEQKDWALARKLIVRCGELGLLGVDVPERLGGVALDKVSAVIVGEAIGPYASFATTFGAQTGLSIIPILCFGTEAQQQKYLPRIVSGEIIGAYCLSESGSGSDALGARTRATRDADGAWVLNGEKMWITNGGFADIFIVFAKVDAEQFSAFIVERSFPGVSSGKEEHKLGLLGSSTTPVILADARVPAENLLGDIGRGHKIAFNVLNYGRFKLAAMCTGGAKAAIAEAAAYASTRRQFGHAIASFGAIRHKLAEMTIRTYGVESALFRTAGLIDETIGEAGHDGRAVAAALEEFAIEASLLKIAGSEMLDFVLDENVQIHGGNGFVKDYPAERHYRDARVNRIFEGTNEINRLLVPGIFAKRAIKGGLPIISAAKQLQDELLSPSPAQPDSDRPIENARRTVTGMKRTVLMLLGLAMQTYAEKLADEQEILTLLSDVLMQTFLAESAVLRAEQALGSSERTSALQEDAASVLAHDAATQVDTAARTALAAMASGDTLRTYLAALRRTLKVPPVNTIAVRRRIAAEVVDSRRYIFQ